jgi:hypothetical protein
MAPHRPAGPATDQNRASTAFNLTLLGLALATIAAVIAYLAS